MRFNRGEDRNPYFWPKALKRGVCLILIVLLVTPIYSKEEKTKIVAPLGYEYEPYEENEFPSWAMELRRAETIFFGSFVITLPISMLSFSLADRFSNSFNPNPGMMMLYEVGAASALSLIVVGIDWLLGLNEDKK